MKKERDYRRLLEETLIIKNLSPEKAAPFFPGVSARQIRRWIERKSYPRKGSIRIIKAGIEKIDKKFKDSLGWAGEDWQSKEADKRHSKHEIKKGKIVKKAFNLINMESRRDIKELIFDPETDYFFGFQEVVGELFNLGYEVKIIKKT